MCLFFNNKIKPVQSMYLARGVLNKKDKRLQVRGGLGIEIMWD